MRDSAALYVLAERVRAGRLTSHGSYIADRHCRGAGYVDRILGGATPADLPVEQPGKFEVVVNLETARALDLAIPPSVLRQADEVIE